MSWNPEGDSKRYATDCGAAMGYYQRLPIRVAAALWCDVPPDQVQWVLDTATEVGRAIYQHQRVTCLEPKCRALHEAIEAGQLPVYREQGGACPDHVAPDRRHVSRAELRGWISKHYPDQKPSALFDEAERTTHPAINADAFRALQADRDAARAELKKAEKWGHEILAERDALRLERDQLRALIDKMGEPGERAETTFLNIIGALLGLLLGKTPAGKPQSVYDSQASIISALLAHYGNKPGIAPRTLEEKFAAAKKRLAAT